MRKSYRFTRTSSFSGEVNSLDITLDMGDYHEWAVAGSNIQRAMPYLTADEREFLMTGITAEEWEESFGED